MDAYENIIKPILRPPVRAGRKILAKYRDATAHVNQRLVLITAHPRSGTTATARLLAKHTGLRAFTATGEWTMADKDIIQGRRTLEEVIARNRYAFSCDIMSAADAGSFLPILKATLPEMRIAFLVRDPRDMICSVIEVINKFDLSSDQISDLDYRYLQCDWLGIREKNPIKKLALRWCKWLEIAKSVQGVTYWRYEQFLEDKAAFLATLANELGLPSRHDVSASMDQQLNKPKTIPIRGAGRWKDLLAPETARLIEEICSKGMEEFGYEPGG